MVLFSGLVSSSIKLAIFQASGDADTLYETSWNSMPFSRSISPQRPLRTQRLSQFFFLSALGDLCGELTVSLSI